MGCGFVRSIENKSSGKALEHLNEMFQMVHGTDEKILIKLVKPCRKKSGASSSLR